MMAIINTRNVHRSNMLMGFPYGQDFVYDEMVLTGPGEKGEANAKRVLAANTEKTGPVRRSRARDRRRKSARTAMYDLLFVAHRARRPQVRAAVKGDRDPGYGSTSKMISECAICLLRDTPDVAGRHLDARRGDGAQADQAAGRSCRADVQGREVVSLPRPACGERSKPKASGEGDSPRVRSLRQPLTMADALHRCVEDGGRRPPTPSPRKGAARERSGAS